MKEGSPQQKLDQALIAFRRALTLALLKEAKAFGCTLSHLEALRYIAGQENIVSMKEIAACLHITPPSASALVDTLVTKGLVVRNAIPDDRRSVHIGLASKGRQLLASIYVHKHSVFETMLSKLNTDDTDTLARILITLSQ